ncbi:putative bifunctional diguanylate cyclase/phosphodiesterase [Lichenihabitans psoromatis]|uniref:putative bifunctional diguanylate cyclase/phosphodiesterase n=1 Tax=Lichenihabitans psoromatis TaxID=2528642 RepID=UPI0013F148A1|nr:EAL domain-containing protein [Lichenihabitans psoromatis]
MPAIFGRLLLVGVSLAAVSLIAWLGWSGQQARDEARSASQHAIRVAELRGTIAYLDEWMTQSARLAAASGEHRWADRFDEAAPKLNAALAEAAGLASPETRTAMAGTTGEAHRDLVTMERRALALAAADDLASARTLLDGPEFAYLKDVYASGVEIFGQNLATYTETRTELLNDRAWREAMGLALAVLAVVSAGLSIRGRVRHARDLGRVATVALIDTLTDLPNRRGFYEAAASLLAEPFDEENALLLIDLDRFKTVNDAHGHPAGDEVLKLVASRLRGIVRGGDIVARLGGDEFALMLGTDRGVAWTGSRSEAVAARILAALAEPFVLEDGTAVRIGASVGIAPRDVDCKVLSDLIHRADVALSRAKAGGRHCFRVFEPAMEAKVRARALLERDLRLAIVEDAIVPHYQPLVDLRTGAMVGVEMLARWPHPLHGMVPPDAFIPIAEELGLIGHMTERLLARACRETAGWPGDVTIACNLSPLQLADSGLSLAIQEVLERTGFPPHRLELEITESALVGDLDLARASLGQLKAIGVRLALDDFGTGYSSLRHLQTLPFDKIKIDRSFVAAMSDNAESGKIVAAVVGLGHSLGLSTVAEGIETEAIAGLLRTLGCDIGQGWLFGKPVPAHRIAALLGAEQLGPDAAAVAA